MAKTAQEKIVHLQDFDKIRNNQGARDKALDTVRKIAATRLQTYLVQMMDKVDDALFCRAEIAENNTVQTRYFDAMREMRIIRPDIERDFSTALNARFSKGVPRDSVTAASADLSWDSVDGGMGLVDKNDMEEELAVANLVNKIRGNCGQLLFALDKRIGFLIDDPDLERWSNPFGPESICTAFREAAGHIQTGIEIRLVTFKLFDQHVAGYLDELYKELNQTLVKLGVLPQIKVTVRKSGTPTGSPAGGHFASGSSGSPTSKFPPSEYSTPDLQAIPMAAGIVPSQFNYGHTNPTLQVLTLLQQGERPATADGALCITSNELLSGNKNVLHGIKNSSLIHEMGNTSDTTIDVVATIFDYILDDRNIPDPMRALIGRLQIPILKVALLDQTFLSRKTHPARLLLNRLAATAVSWSEKQGDEDPVYKKVQAVVQTVLEQFEENIELFESILEDFDDFLEKEESAAELRAERSAKVMEGQERLDIAETTTLEEIEPRVNDSGNLDFVREFVTTHWKNLLFICCARNGKDSDAWKQAVKTMDELIWSVKPKRTPEQRQRLVSIQPKLLQSLRNGMERLSIPATERDDFISLLVRAHGRTAIQDDASESPADSPQNTDETTEPAPAPKAETRTEKVATTSPLPAISDPYLNQAKMLKPGAWLEFIGSDGKATRGKLSWISPITGTLLFTDRQGLKAGNYDVEELAKMLDGRLARILDTAPLMDRVAADASS
jgi:hypothetical protein